MIKFLIIIFISIISFSGNGQSESDVVLEAEATITNIDFRINGRRSVSEASVNYTTQDGISRNSKVKLAHIPFITSIYNVGDKVTIHYKKENPGILTTPSLDFINSYGLYILISLGVLISIIRLYKIKLPKNA